MNQIKAFDLSRVGLLIKKEIFYQRRAPWIIVGAVFVFLLFIQILMAYEDPGPNDLPANQVIFYIIIILALGTIFTAASFNELNNKSSAHHYLSIPASSLEKLVSKWLVTGIMYVIAFNIFYFIFCLLSTMLTESLFSQSAGFFNPFEQRVELDLRKPWFFSQLYLTLHTIYLAGAIYFRRFSYFKTIIAQFFIVSVLIGLIALVSSLIYIDVWQGDNEFMHVQLDDRFKELIERLFPNIAKIFLWFIFPLWMLVFSYFKLRETEV